MPHLTSFKVFGAQQTRLLILAEQQTALDRLAEQEKALVSELLELAPKNVRAWLKDERVIEHIIRYGAYAEHVVFGRHGFGKERDVRSKIAQLSKQWSDQLVIVLEENVDGDNRIAIGIRAATYF